MGFSNENESTPIAAARATVWRMVSPGGCAWHEVQTHATLIPFLIEETAEFIDAVERGLPPSEVAEELGDVLYQVLFHAAIAERDGEGYDLDAVAERLDEKLRARHPHVFGERGYMTVEELHAEWERLKEDAAGEARGSRDPLEGIPAGMPTLARTAKVIERLKRAKLLGVPGEDAKAHDVSAEAHAVTGEVRAVSTETDAVTGEAAEVALGDAMLDLVISANATGVDPDRALRLATQRLAERLGL